MEAGTSCPFSGHVIPPRATVCVCGAYYGYSNPRVNARSLRQVAGLVVLAVVMLGVGYVLFHASPEDSKAEDLALWLFILGLLPALISVLSLVAGVPVLLRGKGWWRNF